MEAQSDKVGSKEPSQAQSSSPVSIQNQPSAHVKHPTSQSLCAFFSIPLEIRFMIYNLVLKSSTQPIKIPCTQSAPWDKQPVKCLGILLTCRRIASEADGLYYQLNHLYVNSDTEIFLRSLSPIRLSDLRHITFFIVHRSRNSYSCFSKTFLENLEGGWRLLNRCTGLLNLCLEFEGCLVSGDMPYFYGVETILGLRGLKEVELSAWTDNSTYSVAIKGPKADLIRKSWTQPRITNKEELQVAATQLADELDLEEWRSARVYHTWNYSQYRNDHRRVSI